MREAEQIMALEWIEPKDNRNSIVRFLESDNWDKLLLNLCWWPLYFLMLGLFFFGG